MSDQTSGGFKPEEDMKLQQLINLTKQYEPSQIVELGDDRILVAVPWRSTAEKASSSPDAGSTEIRHGNRCIVLVEPQHIMQAIALGKTLDAAIDKEGGLDTEKVLKIIKADPTLALVGTLNTTIREGTSKVSVVADKVLMTLGKVFQLMIDSEREASLALAVLNTFTNLRVQKDYIVWKEKQERQTTYVRSFVFIVQNIKTGAVMLALPISFEITADKNYEELLDITLKDTASYEVLIKTIRVAQPLKK